MPSSRRLHLTPEAEDDLAAIWQYTAARWDEQQADTYTDLIRTKLADLAAFPGLGKQRDDLSLGLRSHPVGQHLAFYRVSDDDLDLIVRRIIHSRRDIDADLIE